MRLSVRWFSHLILVIIHRCDAFFRSDIPCLKKTVRSDAKKLHVMVDEVDLKNRVCMALECLEVAMSVNI